MAFVKRIEVQEGQTYDIRDESAIHDLPIATKTELGCVAIGDGLDVSDGTISAKVRSVNNKTGVVNLTASDVSAVPISGGTMTGNLTVGSASLQTNGYVTSTWLKTTADTHLGSAATNFAVLSGGWIYSRTASEVLSDIGAVSDEYGIPPGAIIMWSGETNEIPTGWVLCDGENDTPDLRNRFVIGAGDAYSVGETGGGSSTTSVGDVVAGPQATVSTSSLPPYYALCYIMKT